MIQAEVGEVKLELAEAEVRAESNMLRAAQLVEELRAEQGNASRAETEKKEVAAALQLTALAKRP